MPLRSSAVANAAERVLSLSHFSWPPLLAMARAAAEALGDQRWGASLAAEMEGYGDPNAPVPAERRVRGYASAFPVRALELGVLSPQEVFSGNMEKFAPVEIEIRQPLGDLEAKLARIQAGGVLAVRMPAAQFCADGADVDGDVEVHVYVLPEELGRLLRRVREGLLLTMSKKCAALLLGRAGDEGPGASGEAG